MLLFCRGKCATLIDNPTPAAYNECERRESPAKRKGEDAMKTDRRILGAFLLNLLFAAIEVVGGILTGSIAILSDAVQVGS